MQLKIVESETCSFETMKQEQIDRLAWHAITGRVTFPMQNHGNTCFFNAVMQCLTHTVPFYNLMV